MFSFLRKGVTNNLNIKKWIDFDHLKATTKTVTDFAEDLSKVANPSTSRKETFDQAVKRMGLTEADIQQRQQSAIQIALSCLALTPFTLGYGVYLLINVGLLSATVAVMMTLLLSAYAFREGFNYYQIKQRRLGCSVREWLLSYFK